jgi:hypothetical protein
MGPGRPVKLVVGSGSGRRIPNVRECLSGSCRLSETGRNRYPRAVFTTGCGGQNKQILKLPDETVGCALFNSVLDEFWPQ